MNREHDRSELIDLGTASVETQGGAGTPFDEQQQFPLSGLTDD